MYRSSPFRSTLNTSYISFGHVLRMYRSSPFRSTLNTSYIRFGHVLSMYRSSPFRSTLNTSYTLALNMCWVCTEAVHSVALWTRVTLGLDMCWAGTEAVHSVALWTRVTSPLWTCVALDQCEVWTPFGHFCPYFHTPYMLLCPKDDFTFTFPRGLIWKIDNPSTTLSFGTRQIRQPLQGRRISRVPQTTRLSSRRQLAGSDSNFSSVKRLIFQASWVGLPTLWYQETFPYPRVVPPGRVGALPK